MIKNKKGFTLIELLAVIAILAILLVFALPNVIQSMRNAKKSTFLENVQSIMTNAVTQARVDASGRRKVTTYCRIDGNGCVGYEMLDLTGTKTIDFIVKVSSKYTVDYLAATDGEFQIELLSGDPKAEDPTKLSIEDVVDLSENSNLKFTVEEKKNALG